MIIFFHLQVNMYENFPHTSTWNSHHVLVPSLFLSPINIIFSTVVQCDLKQHSVWFTRDEDDKNISSEHPFYLLTFCTTGLKSFDCKVCPSSLMTACCRWYMGELIPKDNAGWSKKYVFNSCPCSTKLIIGLINYRFLIFY